MPNENESREGAVDVARAYITRLVAESDTEKPYVSVVVEYAGKQARLQIEVGTTTVEQAALPEVLRRELASFMDALEQVTEGNVPLTLSGQ